MGLRTITNHSIQKGLNMKKNYRRKNPALMSVSIGRNLDYLTLAELNEYRKTPHYGTDLQLKKNNLGLGFDYERSHVNAAADIRKEKARVNRMQRRKLNAFSASDTGETLENLGSRSRSTFKKQNKKVY
jgi:hypothetical protein